ncbi:FAD-binding protein, partial [Streptomyces sp. Agncl-13]|uniref:FAD-binding protein n=1 Tax=Streptomyces sp. Agncl-13 TaxID=3400628 RepID=UPI003A895575
LGTKGGLKTDEHARVLRPDGSVISGLYASGNTMAPMSGRIYPAGRHAAPLGWRAGEEGRRRNGAVDKGTAHLIRRAT